MSSRPALRTLTALVLAAALVAVPAGRGTAAPAGAPVTTPLSDRAQPGDEALARDAARNELSRERFYFAMTDRFANGDPANDRGGLQGDRQSTGFDPADKGYYQGGDLKGLIAKLDYIQGLGTTALWITPAFKNRPVQQDSAGYHGYWITDFTRIDPHLGTNAEMKQLVKLAHRRGMKVFFDIITNHTADVVDYAEGSRAYRSKGAYPYVDTEGRPFDDRDHAGRDTFPKVDTESFPYTPVGSRTAKTPGWLNDPTMYHNRGDSAFTGESSEYGDFFGLDDLWTERPEVVQGMIDIYRTWVKETGVDGFRIDTAKHVNMEFWERFSPAVNRGRFFVFGEVFSSDPAFTSRYSTRGGMDATLDFPFQDAARSYAGGKGGAAKLSALYAADDHHLDADSNAASLPTFLGNHDMGRIGHFLAQDAPAAELLQRDKLAHELMYLTRGQPVVYYGDEQGFTGAGGDKDARASLFASRTPDYLDDDLIGTDATHARDNYDPSHPLYRHIAALAHLRDRHPTLADGAQVERLSQAGLYAFSRIDARQQVEYVVAINNATTPATARVPTYSPSTPFHQLYGPAPTPTTNTPPTTSAPPTTGSAPTTPPTGPAASQTPGAAALPSRDTKTTTGSGMTVPAGAKTASVTGATTPTSGAVTLTSGADAALDVTVPPMSAVVFRAGGKLATPAQAPRISLTLPGEEIRGTPEDERVEIRATVPGDGFDQVTFAAKAGDGPWRVLGTDDAPGTARTYRIFHDLRGIAAGTPILYKAVVKDSAGRHASATAQARKGPDPKPGEPATRDWLVVHYQRQDPDGWGLHVWGDVERPTEWGTPVAFQGEDAFGRFAWIKLKPGATSVGLLPHKGDEKDGGDREVNPARTGEVWLVQGKEPVYASRQAAQGYATVRYRRTDGAYTGWGLHLWGEAVAEPTDWASPKPPDGTDSFGAFWKVPLKAPDRPVDFIVHRGDEKDPGPDQSFTGPEAYVNSGQAQVHATRAAADGVAVLHYHRPDGNYDGWGLHVWGGAATPTEWNAPLPPSGRGVFGVYWRVPLADGAKGLSYIVHKGEEKDQATDQRLDGDEAWKLSGVDGYVLPQQAGGADVDLKKLRAHWIARDTVVWQAGDDTVKALESTTGTVKRLIRLLPGTLTDAQKAKWPHLKALPAFKVDPRDAALVPDALRAQVAAVEHDAGGRLLTATGVQLPGVLDDLYATDEPLGYTGDRLALWAPTAQRVRLALYDEDSATYTEHAMRRDAKSGVWSVRVPRSWRGRDYTYLVTVHSPAHGRVVTNEVTDPYSLAVAADGVRSRLADLDAQRPPGWTDLAKPPPKPAKTIYELHVRDFSAADATVPQDRRGTYQAFTGDGAGMRALRELARDGLTHVHLLPVFDLATVPERRADRTEPDCDLAALPPDSPLQQECVAKTAAKDGFNWGYDPLHYTVPEGSYATDPDARTREFRSMVAGLNRSGLRVVMDVVYNHTHSTDVLDTIVPGYYHRLLPDGTVATSTCCPNTAPEHAMMGRLVVDSVVTWARDYKVDGFRFDLMGHHPKANILAVRRALDALTPAKDGVDGKDILLYGEGWNFGEVADDARFEQATQANLAGTGIATFNDRLRDGVRGGGPFDADPRVQGFGSGLAGDLNGGPANGDAAARLAHYQDLIMLGLTGNLRYYVLPDGRTGADVLYNGQKAGYAAHPSDVVTYVDAHDNETLYDALAYKLPPATDMAARVRMQALSLATALLGQGTAFVHAGSERLRSKSLDRNSYDSGDWFNRLHWDCASGNGFGAGLPPKADNEARWPYARPLLADPGLRPDCAAISAARERFGEFLRIRGSSPLFALGAGTRERVSFPAAPPGVIAMRLDGTGLDPRWSAVTVVFNATPGPRSVTVAELKGTATTLHPEQADPVAGQSRFDAATGALTVPGRTAAVFVSAP
ncbi:pullulanase-type alpha-1,6-glucosidase [Nonomuraea endophytica]|uniref:pullulanase-type alpha-1,6-glucosidase n=1 Tax=Nonomuraea endophytica TaxID=714136 RepID=UPI0037C8F4B5